MHLVYLKERCMIMPVTEINFSEYATAFYEIIEGKKGNKAEFVKALLKMGLNANEKGIINEMFPQVTTSKGENAIENQKADQLRKYLHGKNGISNIASELEGGFDEDLYIVELQDYEDSKLIEFAQKLKLDTDLDSIDEVRSAIAACYHSIINKASTKKNSKPNKTNDSKDIILSHTISKNEKKALLKLCELILTALRDLKNQTIEISNKQHELNNLTNSEEDKLWKPHLEYQIASAVKRFDEAYPKLEKLCADITKLLEPKKHISANFEAILLIAKNISNDEYKSMCPEKYKYIAFWHMISQFNDKINQGLCVIDKL